MIESPSRPLRSWPLLLGGLLLILGIIALVALRWGAVDIPTKDWIEFIMSRGNRTSEGTILLEVRLPRILLAIAAGTGLAAAGSTWQALLRNPLADPYLLGVSAGAALGAGIAIFFGQSLPGGLNLVPVLAFLGALGAVALVHLLAGRDFSIERMLLVGMAVSAFLSAALSLLVFWHAESFTTLYFWMLGGFSGRDWDDLRQVSPYLVVGLVLILSQLRHLNVLQLGTERARTLGVDPRRTHRILLAGATLATAAVVAACGMIGFVGLVMPHLARQLVGPDLRKVLPTSCVLGAILLVGADLLARTAWAPAEVPVGVLTALLGAPFFLYLVMRRSA